MEPVAGQSIRQAKVITPAGLYMVQTIRLSDHPAVRQMERILSVFSPVHAEPAVFETQVFRLPAWTIMNPAFACKRYQDIDDAIEGHEEMILHVAAGKVDGSCN